MVNVLRIIDVECTAMRTVRKQTEVELGKVQLQYFLPIADCTNVTLVFASLAKWSWRNAAKSEFASFD